MSKKKKSKKPLFSDPLASMRVDMAYQLYESQVRIEKARENEIDVEELMEIAAERRSLMESMQAVDSDIYSRINSSASKRCRDLVEDSFNDTGKSRQEIWGEIYTMLHDFYGIDVRSLKKEEKGSYLSAILKNGYVEEILDCTKKVCK